VIPRIKNAGGLKKIPPHQQPEDSPHKLEYASLGKWFFTQFVQSAEAMVAERL